MEVNLTLIKHSGLLIDFFLLKSFSIFKMREAKFNFVPVPCVFIKGLSELFKLVDFSLTLDKLPGAVTRIISCWTWHILQDQRPLGFQAIPPSQQKDFNCDSVVAASSLNQKAIGSSCSHAHNQVIFQYSSDWEQSCQPSSVLEDSIQPFDEERFPSLAMFVAQPTRTQFGQSFVLVSSVGPHCAIFLIYLQLH